MMMMLLLLLMMMIMMVMVGMVIIVVITVALTIRDIFQSPHCAANCLQHVRPSGPGATVCTPLAIHQTRTMRNMSRATRHEGTAQLLTPTELHLLELYFIG